jgi:DNA-binding transcriptional regulator YiaG
MDPQKYDYAVWWSDEDQCHVARAVTLEAGTGYGDTPAAALADAIALATANAELGHAPAGRVLAERGLGWTPDAIRALRRSLALNQEEFAALLNVTPHAVRHWEQGNRNISGSSARLLDFVAAAPGLVHRWIIEREDAKSAAA